MRRRLIGHHVGLETAPHQVRQHLGAVADQTDGECFPGLAGRLAQGDRLVRALHDSIDVSRFQPSLRPAGIHFDDQGHALVHRDRQRLSTAHPAETAGQHDLPLETVPALLRGESAERLVRALKNALRADVDPAAGRHLAVHDQALGGQLVEVLLRRPVRARGWSWRSGRAGRRCGV